MQSHSEIRDPGATAARPRQRPVLLLAAAFLATMLAAESGASAAGSPRPSSGPDFGPNVQIFDPSMSVTRIKTAIDSIASKQVANQFGAQRYALLFKPGTYGSAASPLNFEVGYYTSVMGLGRSPGDVVINGSVYVRNQCTGTNCIALNNFWRSLSNVTINVTNPSFGCYTGQFWAVSQAAPMRRVHVKGLTTLMDYCTNPSYASGGFIADSAFEGDAVVNGSQQQWFIRNSAVSGWSNGVWNQVFSGVIGAPAQCFPGDSACGPYTTLATSPVTREAPYLYVDTDGTYKVFVPAAQTNSAGTSWGGGLTPGVALSINDFRIAKPGDAVATINGALGQGKHVIFTPGVYQFDQPIAVTQPDTVVLGLGFSTIVPTTGKAAMTVADVTGVKLSGLMFDAGPTSSPVLLQVGTSSAYAGSPVNPTTLSDVFFRIGGATAGKAATSLVVNSGNVILDDLWAWRADHGTGVGWTANTADTGVIVNGANVTAYGLFVEHYQKHEVIWNGQNGRVIFFQNEMPYDPPSQAAWTEAPGVAGWAALKVADTVTSFSGYGMGSYSFFNQGVDIYAASAFRVPATLPAGSLRDLLTVFLDSSAGKGGILNVVNGTGGASTIANPSTPVTVTSYP